MALVRFKLPDVGEGVVEAEIVEWRVAVGDIVEEDQSLVDVMTDKATVDIPSPVAGEVKRIHGAPGDVAPVGSVIIEIDASVTPAAGDDGGEAPAHEPQATPAPAPESASVRADDAAPPASANGDVLQFKLPDVGEGVVEAEIVEWRVAVGDMVEEDQSLVDVMTDKATVDIPSPVAGQVTRIHGGPGDIAAVGSVIIEIATQATAAPPPPASEPDRSTSAASVAAPPPAPAAVAQGGVILAPVREKKRALAAPAVRKRAREAGLDLATVSGTGAGGRVTHADLDALLSQGGTLALAPERAPSARARREGVRELKIIGLRRKIAEAMTHAATTIPHFSYVEEVDVTALEELRAHLNANRQDGQAKLTVLPFLCQALVRVLPDFPEVNATFDGETGVLTAYEGVHVGVATATPDGLLVPVMPHAEARDVWDSAAEIKRLAETARAGRCKRSELSGSTITISSLGHLGGVVSTPVINAPEVAIIGVNKIVERPAFDDAGRVVPRKMMNLSSSFDHRIVDGDVAARLIQRVKGLLEQPAALFM